MNVRDKSLPKTDYKGHEGWALDQFCPCRPCWNMHDCGHLNSQGKWQSFWHCATNWNSGCPDDNEPVHLFPEGKRKCVRCGAPKPKRTK